MSSGTFGYPLCFTAMLVAIGLMVLPRTDEAAKEAARKARLENMRRGAIAAEIIARCDDFLRNYPESEVSEKVAMNAAAQCVELGRWAEVGTRYRDLEEKFPRSENLDLFVFFQGIAMFQEVRFKEALPLFNRGRRSFPTSAVAENASYYLAMSYFLNQQNEQALAASHEYLRLYPDGRYAGSLRKRFFSIDFSDKKGFQSEKIIRELSRFVAEHPDDPANGSMLCLLADTYLTKKVASEAGEKSNKDNAINAYTRALWTDSPDDVIQYALGAATSMLRTRKDWRAVAYLHKEFLSRKPHSQVAKDWVEEAAMGRDHNREISRDILASLLKSDFANPDCEHVEDLVDLLATSFVQRRESSVLDWGPADLALARLLNDIIAARENVTTTARLNFARARLAQLLKRKDRADLYLNAIVSDNAKEPSALSPRLLEICGNILLKKGDLDGAEAMFKRLRDHFPNASNHDAGRVGLGNVALARKQPEVALGIFEEVLKKPAGTRFNEATLGKLQALVELDQLDAAEKLALVITSDKAFRGEPSGRALLLLARTYRKQADKAPGEHARELLKKARAALLRVSFSYVGYPELVEEAGREAAEIGKLLGD